MSNEIVRIIKADGVAEYEFLDSLKDRGEAKEKEVEIAVSEIIADVAKRGDAALHDYCLKFDGKDPENFEVSQKKIKDSYYCNGHSVTIEAAAKKIFEYHEKQKQNGYAVTGDGTIVGQRVIPLERVGIYIPGGTAFYPSSVLMTAIPAKVAGVKEIIMVTPPTDKKEFKNILSAAKIAGVDKVYTVGGAQAIAALAYGTETIPKVDKIVGPGNIYVATAKKLLYGKVDIDSVAGPSEILIIADETANPVYLAADMLSQAEHDKLASSLLFCTSEELANKVREELAVQLEVLPRKEIAAEALANASGIIVCDVDSAIKAANYMAPEHLELMIKDPFDKLDAVRNAGSVFLGENSPEPLGDYMAGPNHVLPTSGTARFFSQLSVDSFVKKSSYIYYNKEALAKVGEDIIKLANKETLGAHANSIKVRLNNK